MMNNNILEYKNYHAKIEFDTESLSLYGKIEGISDLVNFESNDPRTIEMEFHAAVDDYLEFCEEVGKEPEKEYKGSFNVRISPELHRKLAMRALKEGISQNAVTEKALREYLLEIPGGSVQKEMVIVLPESLETYGIFNRNNDSITTDWVKASGKTVSQFIEMSYQPQELPV